jgi:uncharacterized protein
LTPVTRRFGRVAALLPGPLFALLALVMLLAAPLAAAAVSAADLPARPPADHVIDGAEVFSRASRGELERKLADFGSDRVDARLVTVSRLDYGLSLDQLGRELIERWSAAEPASEATSGQPLLLLLIDAKTKATAVLSSPSLERQLPAQLQRSTARTTMALPLREGNRYRQGSVDALDRLAVVLQGGEDPGEPVQEEAAPIVSNVPSKEETAGSNAFTWVVVLLVVGSVVPMVTWWVFSR